MNLFIFYILCVFVFFENRSYPAVDLICCLLPKKEIRRFGYLDVFFLFFLLKVPETQHESLLKKIRFGYKNREKKRVASTCPGQQ